MVAVTGVEGYPPLGGGEGEGLGNGGREGENASKR